MKTRSMLTVVAIALTLSFGSISDFFGAAWRGLWSPIASLGGDRGCAIDPNGGCKG